MNNQIFEYKLMILEKHLDTMGHVNNATYLQIFEESRWDFITKNNFGLEEIKKSQIGPVVLDLSIKFKKEVLNREVILIKSQFIGMKNSYAMKMKQEMIKSDQKLASELELSVGLMDFKTRRLIKPTEQWLKAIGGE